MFVIIVWLAVGSAVLLALGGAPVGVTKRSGLLLCAAALSALFTTPRLALTAALLVGVATAVDLVASRGRPSVVRAVDRTLARGVAVPLRIEAAGRLGTTVRVRQPLLPDLQLIHRHDSMTNDPGRPTADRSRAGRLAAARSVASRSAPPRSVASRSDPAEADRLLESMLLPRRRGRHLLPPPASRVTGPLGLGAWYRKADGDPLELSVYPDLPAARRLAQAVRKGRFRDAGLISRGPLGLGTEFELVREYNPDDDVRQVNWRATQRMGRPMSNQYRVEQDRDVLIVVDCGRLMAAPLTPATPDAPVLTRLDASLDAAAAVAYVADEVGDRCGTIAFDDLVRCVVPPRRRGGEAVVQATFALEPSTRDSDYDAAFRRVGSGKRALVLVLTDLLDESAAAALVAAVPVLARRHAVVVASAADPDLTSLLATPPSRPEDVYRASVALDVLDARTRVTASLRRVGADVIDASPDTLARACVSAYLRAKARAQL